MSHDNLESKNIYCQNEISCSKIALVPCHHCTKMLCIEHLGVHNELNIIRSDELTDEINLLTESLSNLNTEKSLKNARNQLDTWKTDCINKIENIYENYTKEIDKLEIDLNSRLNTFKENIDLKICDLKQQLSRLKKDAEMSKNQLSPIESNLDQLKQCLETIQCHLSIEIKDLPCTNLINLKNIFMYNYKSLNNTKLQSYRKLPIENLKEFISSDVNQTILCLNQQKQLVFIDEAFQIHLLTLPEGIYGNIVELKWCSNAKVFLILFQRYLLSFNPKTHQFNKISLIRYKNYPFQCIICLKDQSLYISYSTSGICIELYKYSIDNNSNMVINECIKQYNCLTNDKNEWLSNMSINCDSHIGLLIRKGSTIYRRFEIRDQNLDLIKTIELDNDFIDKFYPFQNSYWYIKSLSGKYWFYSQETNKCCLSKFDFPYGLQEIGINTIVIGNNNGELTYRDI